MPMMRLPSPWAKISALSRASCTALVKASLRIACVLLAEKSSGLYRKKGPLLTPLKHCLTMFFVVLGWVLFRANHLAQAGLYLRSMFGLNGNRFLDDTFCFYGREYLTVFLAGIFGALPTVRRIKDGVRNHGHIRLADFLDVLTPWAQLILFIVSVSCLIMGAHNPFIYFNF